MTPDPLPRLSLNQWTIRPATVPEAAAACARHGIGAIGLWREHVADFGLTRTAKLMTDTGLRVSSLCRGGFFSRPGWRDDNRAAIDEAAALGAACLVLVPGGLPAVNPPADPPTADNSKKLPQARQHVTDAIAELVPYARQRQVRLAIEPMHPMYCADRGVVSTLKQALDMAAPYPPEAVGVVIDTFHLWWDPDLGDQIQRAGEENRIASFQVSDFLSPLPADVLLGRAMMGDGVIDFAPIIERIAGTGYQGDIEVEIFNADVWATAPDDVLATMRDRYATLIAPQTGS